MVFGSWKVLYGKKASKLGVEHTRLIPASHFILAKKHKREGWVKFLDIMSVAKKGPRKDISRCLVCVFMQPKDMCMPSLSLPYPWLHQNSELQPSSLNYSPVLIIFRSANWILDNVIPNEMPYMLQHLSNHQKFCLIRKDLVKERGFQLEYLANWFRFEHGLGVVRESVLCPMCRSPPVGV